jgi:hypothetical protein
MLDDASRWQRCWMLALVFRYFAISLFAIRRCFSAAHRFLEVIYRSGNVNYSLKDLNIKSI